MVWLEGLIIAVMIYGVFIAISLYMNKSSGWGYWIIAVIEALCITLLRIIK